MRVKSLLFTLALVPGVAMAQTQSQAQGSARAEAGLDRAAVLAHMSAEGRAQMQAVLDRSQAQHLPSEVLLNLVAEGQVKGAAETAILAAADRMETQLSMVQQTMIQAGRPAPTDAEITQGQHAVAQGVSGEQLAAVVRSAPKDRPLTVAFAALTELQAQGLPVDQAVARVQGRLQSGVPDAQLGAGATGSGAGAVNAASGLETATGASAGAGASSAGLTTAGNAAAGVGATVHGRP